MRSGGGVMQAGFGEAGDGDCGQEPVRVAIDREGSKHENFSLKEGKHMYH